MSVVRGCREVVREACGIVAEVVCNESVGAGSYLCIDVDVAAVEG